MLFENYKDIFFTNEFSPLNNKDLHRIKKEIIPLLTKSNCEIVNYTIKNEQIILVISRISFLSRNSGKANLIIKMSNKKGKFIVEAQISQNLFAVVFLFGIICFLLFSFSTLLIVFLKLRLLSVCFVILFNVFFIYLFYHVLNKKDDNVKILEKLYSEICKKHENV